jgi:uncharacterized protein involved in response to NO
MSVPAAPSPPSPWRREPFRVFFPLAILLGWVGVGHWLLYASGATSSYSCYAHGLVQMQVFMPALATGFLLTALPRRTQSAPPTRWEVALPAILLVAGAVAALMERALPTEGAYLALLLLLVRFAAMRMRGPMAGRRPPASFVLVPIALLNGAVGAVLLLAGGSETIALGRLLVEQGVFLSLVLGVGALVLPLVAGRTPPADLDQSPRERTRFLLYLLIGLSVDATLLAETRGFVSAAPLARAAVVAVGLAVSGAWRLPVQPGLHRWLTWVGAWLAPLGLAASGLAPDYRVPALHILFIGGFATLGLGVATHVSFGHLGLVPVKHGRRMVPALALGLLLALLARVAADWSHGYFQHLGWAAASWIAGTAAWLMVLGPRLLRP